MGGANTGTQCHYDVYDNTFVQLHGRKTFTCFPPTQHFNLHVFPDAHPRARKSQVNFDTPDPARFPLFAQRKHGLTFDLGPGDTLVIPAFWFHHVEAKDVSVSMNIFCESPSRSLADKIFGHVIPFDPEWNGMLVLLCFRLLVQEVLQQLSFQPHHFLATVVRSRYQPLYGEEMAIQDFPLLSTPWPWDQVQRVLTETQAKALLVPLATQVATDLKELKAQDEGTCQLVLAHLLELWALQCVGSQDLPRFLRYVLHPTLLR